MYLVSKMRDTYTACNFKNVTNTTTRLVECGLPRSRSVAKAQKYFYSYIIFVHVCNDLIFSSSHSLPGVEGASTPATLNLIVTASN